MTLFSPKTIPFLISQGVGRKLLPVGTLLLGIIGGFLWAYLISPNVYTGAEPVNLGESWKEEWVKQVAWQYSASGAAQVAQIALDSIGNAGDLVNSMVAKFQADPQLLPRLQAIQPFARNVPEQLADITPTFWNSNLTPVLCVVVPAIVIGGAVIFNTIIPIGLLFQRRKSTGSTAADIAEKQRREALAEAQKSLKEAAANQAPVAATSPVANLGAPVSRFVSAYILGDDLYDDTFSIETASGDFLGETGAGISKTLGVGDPKKVAAIECFVFDKTDIRTVTKVLMSEHAYNDEAIRAELAPRGEAVLVKKGEAVYLETAALIVQARVIDLAYGSGALPPNSFYERLTLELSAFQKKGGEGASPMPPAMPPAFDDTTPGRM
jgi:hypothetical protein